jgi:hypothetical protein
MALKFRLKGLAETFVEKVLCPCCGHDGGEQGDEGFRTDCSRVTYEGIIVVVGCEICGHYFLPDGQRVGIIDSRRLRTAIERDCENNGQPLFAGKDEVVLDVERRNSETPPADAVARILIELQTKKMPGPRALAFFFRHNSFMKLRSLYFTSASFKP